MKILLISYYFPPYNAIGAVRVGKLAKYLVERGHEVRVVSARDQFLQPTLPLEIPEEHVVYTPWINLHRPAELISGGRTGGLERGDIPRGGVWRFLKQRVWAAYRMLAYLPDMQIGWLPYALRAALRIAGEWRPDVVYASAMPFTSLLIGRAVARRHGIPWVAELRDLWTDHHAYPYPELRRRVDAAWERRVLAAADGLVTVSEAWAETLRAKHPDRPVAVVMNGFDPADLPEQAEPPASPGLRIVYTGMMYEGRQDPSPLFQAIRSLGERAAEVEVRLYGYRLNAAQQLAELHGVGDRVRVLGPVPYHEALRVQREADVLLLLMWSNQNANERGQYPGKLFEYLAARRPVLAVGYPNGAAERLLEGRGAGVLLRDPEAIAAQLRAWLDRKREEGRIPDLPAEVSAGLTRREQALRLESFLQGLVAPGAAA